MEYLDLFIFNYWAKEEEAEVGSVATTFKNHGLADPSQGPIPTIHDDTINSSVQVCGWGGYHLRYPIQSQLSQVQ